MKFYLFFFFLGLFLLSTAQEKSEIDETTLYMHDGSVYIGQFFRSKTTNNFVLTTSDTITVNPLAIHRRRYSADFIKHTKGAYHYKKGFFGNINYNVGGSSNTSAYQLDWLFGSRISDNIAVGAGMGFHTYDGTVAGIWVWHNFTSVFGYGRIYLNNSKARLYVDTKLGYGISTDTWWEDQHTNGMNWQPGIGFHFASRGKIKMHLGLSRAMQFTSGQETNWDWSGNTFVTEYKLWHRATMFKIGIEGW